MAFDGYYAAEIPNLGKECEWPIREWQFTDSDSLSVTPEDAINDVLPNATAPVFILGYKDNRPFGEHVRLMRIR